MKSDEQLVEVAKSGDDAAFIELVERYQDRLLRFLLTRSRSHADAEDAVQDTFMNAYRYLASFNPRWRFSTWIYRIGIRNLSQSAPPGGAEPGELADPGADPLRDCIQVSERQNLWLTARAILSGDAYTALWLRYAEDMSIKEIATAMDRSVSWVKVTLLRARNRLSAELHDGSREANEGEAYG